MVLTTTSLLHVDLRGDWCPPRTHRTPRFLAVSRRDHPEPFAQMQRNVNVLVTRFRCVFVGRSGEYTCLLIALTAEG